MTLSWSFGANVPANSRSDSRDGALAPGQAFGPYRIEEQIGEGGMSRVYRATDPSGQKVALKLLKAATLDGTRRERFRREGTAAASLNSPGIVRVLDGGEVEGNPFIAYELVEGAIDLRLALRRASLRERVRLLLAAAAAVGHAHAAGVVHRDLKPANLLVDRQGVVRVADFGLALVEGQARLTLDGEVVGTPSYMAPEQTQTSNAEPGPPADVWALGVIFYEALTGARPFPGTRWLELRSQIQQAQPEPPRARNPAIPAELERVCLKALARHPEQRYPHAGALAEDLAQALEHTVLPDDPSGAPAMRSTVKGSGSSVFPLGEVGGFDMREVLGRGGMGIVYRALDHELRREVALKFILEARGNTRRLERFRREGQVTASLNHPSILKVHGAGVLEGIPYLKYELVPEARTLTQACRELDLRDRVALLRDAALGLGHAHAQGIVHRDVKPDNVLVDKDGRVLVADFGLAAAQGMERLTRTGALVGTPHYMAPELVAGERDKVGPATDVWALGVLLFELLAGRRPFEGETLVQLSVAITSAKAPSPRAIDPQIDRKLEAICATALHKDPAKRYANGNAFAEDLRAWLEGKSLTASTVGGDRPLAKRPVAGSLLLLVPLVVVTLGVAVLTRDPKPEGREPVAPLTSSVVPDPPASTPDSEVREGQSEWRAIKALDAAAQQLPQAYLWLARYPHHPQRAEVQAFFTRHRFNYPLFTLRHAKEGDAICTFTSDEQLLIAGFKGLASRWNLRSGLLDQRWPITTGALREVKAMAATRDVLVAGTHLGLHWLDLGSGEAFLDLPGPKSNWIARSPDGQHVAVANRSPVVSVYELATGKHVRSFGGYTSEVAVVAYTPDGERLITLAGYKSELGLPTDCQVCIWDTTQTEPPLVRETFQTLVTCIDVAPDSETFVVGTLPGQVFVCDSRTGKSLYQFIGDPPPDVEIPEFFQRKAHAGAVKGVAFSHDGKTLYSVSQGNRPNMNQLRVWDVATHEEARPQVICQNDLQWLELSPNGELLAIGTDQGTVEIWAAN